MKKLIVLLSIILMIGCSKEVKHKPVVVGKSWLKYSGDNMPDGICRFAYDDGSLLVVEFQDSCYKYSVGDTIIGRAKK